MRWLSLVFFVAALCAGCSSSEEIDTTYGKITGGSRGKPSVNGLSVLAEMFKDAGTKVNAWRRLSPKLHESDVIVWAPDDVRAPGEAQIEFLEDWLWDKNGRTLIYICRDYDAAIMYWNKVAPGAPPEDSVELQRRLAYARAQHAQRRAKMPQRVRCRWFQLERDHVKRQIRSLTSAKSSSISLGGRNSPRAPDWAQGIDAQKLDIEIESRLSAPRSASRGDVEFAPLLQSGKDLLMAQVNSTEWGDSRVIVVVNGSFLLNAPLVNHEHRKLAGRLVSAVKISGRPPAKAIFLESGPGGLKVHKEEPGATYPTGLEPFRMWPIAPVVWQWMALGLVAVMWLFPIFGRPRAWRRDDPSDFGQHITALGNLMEQTGDVAYAQQRISNYVAHARRESGVSHLKSTGGQLTTGEDG